jgi:predicted nucleotidyltransferase
MFKKSREEIAKIVFVSIIEHIAQTNIHCLALCGSVGRNTHSKDSDVDVILILNKEISSKKYAAIVNDLPKKLHLELDLIILLFKNKIIRLDEHTKQFYENDINDAYHLIGNDNIADIFLSSLLFKHV